MLTLAGRVRCSSLHFGRLPAHRATACCWRYLFSARNQLRQAAFGGTNVTLKSPSAQQIPQPNSSSRREAFWPLILGQGCCTGGTKCQSAATMHASGCNSTHIKRVQQGEHKMQSTLTHSQRWRTVHPVCCKQQSLQWAEPVHSWRRPLVQCACKRREGSHHNMVPPRSNEGCSRCACQDRCATATAALAAAHRQGSNSTPQHRCTSKLHHSDTLRASDTTTLTPSDIHEHAVHEGAPCTQPLALVAVAAMHSSAAGQVMA